MNESSLKSHLGVAKRYRIILLVLLLGVLGGGLLEADRPFKSVLGTGRDTIHPHGDFRILFYNVENLFDPIDGEGAGDDEFLPSAAKHWTWKRYRDKCCKIAKVIVAMGGWEPPELVGLCEIENRNVLDGIFSQGVAPSFNYKVIHHDSPDHRGIDVALMYLPAHFSPVKVHFFPVIFPGEESPNTREILYVRGVISPEDTLHVLVNHWPSRWGGQLESEPKRLAAARVVRSCIDSIMRGNMNAQVVVMGDFNDTPYSYSLSEIVRGAPLKGNIETNQLYNLAFSVEAIDGIKSYKYKGRWQMFDQIIVSGSLINNRGTWQCINRKQNVFSPSFLLEGDKVYYGTKPFRTYQGPRYIGGFSDHLPVFVTLSRKKAGR